MSRKLWTLESTPAKCDRCGTVFNAPTTGAMSDVRPNCGDGRLVSLQSPEGIWREKWAGYFEARAAKSMENARAQEPNREKVNSWLDVAAGERACAMMIRSGRSVEELTAALYEPGGHTTP